MATTSSSGLRYPVGTDAANIALYFSNLAADLDRKVIPPFASITARDAAIPAPTVGQTCTVAGLLHTYFATPGSANAWHFSTYGVFSGSTDASGLITITHNLAVAPLSLQLTRGPYTAANASDGRVTALSATQAQVVVNRTDTGAVLATNPVIFYWRADV